MDSAAATAEIRDLKLEDRNNTVIFRDGNKRETIFYAPQENWGTVRNAREFFAAATDGASGTQSIYKTMLDFEAELALVKSTAAPPAPVAAAPVVPATPPPSTPVAPPAPPTIMVSSPSGAGMNQTVELSESSLVIRGVAMDSTGIPVVSINGTAANMRAQNTQAAEFWSDPMPLQAGANPIQITASNSAHVEAKLAFTVHYTPKAAPVNPRALDKAEIISLLVGAVPASRVVEDRQGAWHQVRAHGRRPERYPRGGWKRRTDPGHPTGRTAQVSVDGGRERPRGPRTAVAGVTLAIKRIGIVLAR